MQSLAAFLVGASFDVVPSRQASPLRLQVAGAQTAIPSGQFSAVGSQVSTSSGTAVTVDRGNEGSLATDASLATSGGLEPSYIVKPRDTLWSIADSQLGSPLAWRRIAEANYGRVQPDGGALIDDHWIRPGWLLVIPSSTPVHPDSSRLAAPIRAVPDSPGEIVPRISGAGGVRLRELTGTGSSRRRA